MKRSRSNKRRIKGIAWCLRNFFCIAIYIVQATATWEGPFTDAGYAVWDGERGQAAATIEGAVVDDFYSTSDSYGGQTEATREDIAIDVGYAIWDGYGGQTVTAREFVTRLISVTFVWNGRKVMAKIL